ncbi:hypothetical protein [Ulvibacterium sp.]|uniref:hypothetical protein n=1 Tax=Ulvibacterium sp. TaxID=2665914 RepID=UPI00260951FA|nr:hypothetical protein [Ulvibacterium sp.]
MSRRIKLIWDFRGPVADKTAEHHEKHLEQYSVLEGLGETFTGFQHLNEVNSIAYIVVPESKMIKVRDALKPHRGEIYEEDSQKTSKEG